jgi:hypothetical protein
MVLTVTRCARGKEGSMRLTRDRYPSLMGPTGEPGKDGPELEDLVIQMWVMGCRRDEVRSRWASLYGASI